MDRVDFWEVGGCQDGGDYPGQKGQLEEAAPVSRTAVGLVLREMPTEGKQCWSKAVACPPVPLCSGDCHLETPEPPSLRS